MSKIRHALELVRGRLNEFMDNASPRDDAWVVLSNIVDQTGRPFDGARDKLVMTLANIQYETTISTWQRYVPADAGQHVAVAPPIYINLYLLMYANFYDENYAEGLSVISQAISFFQQNQWFTHVNLPGLDVEIDKLMFEITNLDVTATSYLLGMLGAKYLPAVYYKVRMIPFRSSAVQDQAPPARGIQVPGVPMDQVE